MSALAPRAPSGPGWALQAATCCSWVPLVLVGAALLWPRALHPVLRAEVDGRPVPQPPATGPSVLVVILVVTLVVVLVDRHVAWLLARRAWPPARPAAAAGVVGAYVAVAAVLQVVVDARTAWTITSLLLLTAPGVVLVVRDGSPPLVAVGRVVLGLVLVPVGYAAGLLVGLVLGMVVVAVPLGILPAEGVLEPVLSWTSAGLLFLTTTFAVALGHAVAFVPPAAIGPRSDPYGGPRTSDHRDVGT